MDTKFYNDWICQKKGSQSLQDVCFTRANELNDTVFLAKDTGYKATKNYNSFKNHQEMVDYLDECEEKNHYELIKNQCVEYYDFDYEGANKIVLDTFYNSSVENNNDVIESFLNDFVMKRNSFWNMLRNDGLIDGEYAIKYNDLLVLESCRSDKTSLHVIVRRNGAFKQTIWFNHISDQKKIMQKFKEFLLPTFKNDHCIVLDLSVYNSNSLMRCVGQTKFGKEYYLKPFGKITSSIFKQDKKLLLCSYINQNYDSPPIVLKEQEIVKDNLKDIDYTGFDDNKSVLTLFELIRDTVNKGTNKFLCDAEVPNKINYDVWKNLVFGLFRYLPEETCVEIFPRVFELYRSNKNYKEKDIIKTFLQTRGKYAITIKSLHYWASCHEDYAQKFPKVIEQKNKGKIIKCLNGSHMDIAKLFMKCFGKDNIKITSQKDLTFYLWDNVKLLWVHNPKETLPRIVCDVIFPMVNKLNRELYEEIENITKANSNKENKEKTKVLGEKMKQVQKLLNNLKSSPFLSNICKMIASFSIDEEFESKIINKTKHELPLKDGNVIDFKTLIVRKRTKLDYWSVECNVELNPTIDLTCVDKFFNDIFCGDTDLKNYMQLLSGYLLTGEIKDRSLHIFYGKGCNGKSSFNNILKNIMQDFFTTLSEDITIKKSSRGASPELMDLLYSRCGSLPESDKREELNAKRIKTITGDDEINARHLFGHSIKFKTQCKLIWSTNHKPKIDVEDQAILDRVKLIPFNARFEKTIANTDYIKDLQENKLNEFFNWFVIGANKWYNGSELIPCKSMVDAMKIYINENDVVEEFINDVLDIISEEEYEKVNKLEKNKYRTKKSEVFGMFCCWLNENNRKNDAMGKKEFYLTMEKKCKSIRDKNNETFLCKIKGYTEEVEESFGGLL